MRVHLGKRSNSNAAGLIFLGKLELLADQCKHLSDKSCQKFLQLMLAQQSCKAPLLTFLMLKVWESKPVNCSGVLLKVLLENKKLTDEQLLARFLAQGMPVSLEDVRLAVRCLTSANVAIFKKICSKCAILDLNEMCQEALSRNKLAFMLHFVELGASLPGDGMEIFMNALQAKDFEAAKIIVGLFGQDMFSSLDLAHLLGSTDLLLNADLIELLVRAGIKLNGKVSPVYSVMKCLKEVDQIRILCVLLERGVDCKQLCVTAQRNTTPLHVATDLALKSGKNYSIYVHIRMYMSYMFT